MMTKGEVGDGSSFLGPTGAAVVDRIAEAVEEIADISEYRNAFKKQFANLSRRIKLLAPMFEELRENKQGLGNDTAIMLGKLRETVDKSRDLLRFGSTGSKICLVLDRFAVFPPILQVRIAVRRKRCGRRIMTWKWDRVVGREMVSSSSSTSSSSSATDEMSFFSLLHNYPLISAILAFTIAQFIKFFTAWFKERRWDPKQLLGSGGMPSSHSSTVTALAISIGLQDGFGGQLFAVASILACVVMHDAFGVRLQAGRQAEVLNQIVYELPEEHPLADTRPLRELLGHTPLQVIAGGMLGLIVGVISYWISKAFNRV